MSITIGLTGDVMIGRLVNENLNVVSEEYLWGDILPLLQKNDLNLINLEAALTTSKKKVAKVFNFKAEPSHVNVLKKGCIHVATLSNNHVLDYSEEGLLETLSTLDKAGIQHVGAGRDEEQAKNPVLVDVKGVKVGIIGCTDNEPSWLAAREKPGINFFLVGDVSSIFSQITLLRKKVDILIVSIHWGPNMREAPTRSFINFAHELVEHGVDIIHGHSAHIFQGVEIYKGKLILYDTGDFVDDYAVDDTSRNDLSFFFLVDIENKKLKRLRMIPTLIDNFQVNRAPSDEAAWAIERMKQLSLPFHTKMTQKEDEFGIFIQCQIPQVPSLDH